MKYLLDLTKILICDKIQLSLELRLVCLLKENKTEMDGLDQIVSINESLEKEM